MTTRTTFLGRLLGAVGGLSLGLVLFSAGCDADDDYRSHGGYGDGCERATTCGTCTPLAGCGWCQTPSGEGLCASDPDQCDNVSAFSWTWDPSGCHVPGDAGIVVVPSDASTSTGSDAGPGTPTDAGSVIDAAPVSDATPAQDAAVVP